MTDDDKKLVAGLELGAMRLPDMIADECGYSEMLAAVKRIESLSAEVEALRFEAASHLAALVDARAGKAASEARVRALEEALKGAIATIEDFCKGTHYMVDPRLRAALEVKK